MNEDFLKAVIEMRKLQTAFSETRDKGVLRESKACERRVDGMVLAGLKELFERRQLELWPEVDEMVNDRSAVSFDIVYLPDRKIEIVNVRGKFCDVPMSLFGCIVRGLREAKDWYNQTERK